MRRWLPVLLLSLSFVAIASVAALVISFIGSHLYGDWQLVFQQMQSQSRWLTLCVTCAVAVGLIAKLNEYERQLTSRSLGLTLLGLRLLLILIVFLTLLEPVWTWSFDREILGRVVVAVDVSESMDTSDKHAAPEEKLRWGRSLGMFGKGEKSLQVENWIRELEAGKEPEWVSAEEEPNPARRQQKSQVRKKDLTDSLETVTDYSRLELAMKTLTGSAEPVLEKLSEYVQTQLAIFASDYSSADEQLLEDILAGEEIPLKRKTSDMAQAMNSALDSESDVPLAGVILVSDGRDTSKADQKKLIQRLSGLGVPIHTLFIGSEHRPRDLSVSHIDAPESVFDDASPVVKAIIHSFGFEDQDITVYLENIDDPSQEPLKQVFHSQQAATEVTFKLDDLDLGRHRFRIRTDIEDLELRDDNNSREFSISVVDDKANVLLIEGEGRWEFRYLSTALQRDQRVDIDEVLFEQPYLGILDKPFFERNISNLAPVDGASTLFADYDCVIIGDVSPRHLPLEQWRNLDKYVRDEGGTIVMTAGKRYFPLAYRGTIVNSLLPIENLRSIDLQGANQSLPPRQRGFRFSMTADGEQLAMFQLGDDLNQSRQIWSQLPGHSWGLTGDAKGGATVYAAALNPGERLTLETERQSGIVVQHYVGSGQVLWLGVDSTWRWRFRVGDKFHHRFWGQLIRWAVGFKATAANQNVRLALTRSVMNEDETTRIQSRWNDRFLAQHPGLKTIAIVEATDGTEFRKRLELKPDANRPFMYEADLSDLISGEYRITLETPGLPWEDESPESVLIVREELSEELADLSANRNLMEEIAAASGGRFFYLDEADQIPELFVDTQEFTSVREEIPLWSHWIVLVLFCVVATTEWMIRKLNGLP